MKHQHIISDQPDTQVPRLNGDESDTLVFGKQEAQQRQTASDRTGDVIFRISEGWALIQRLSAWWCLRRQDTTPSSTGEHVEIATEPVWTGHWASTKYL